MSVSEEVKDRVADKLTACISDSGKLVKHLCHESSRNDDLAKAAKAFAAQDSSILAAHEKLKRMDVTLSDMNNCIDSATRSAQSLQRMCQSVNNLKRSF